jgi:hypothetical protein
MDCALLGPGVDVGVGPVLLRTWSWGWAVSERVLVMVGFGEVGGESVEGGWGCRWVSAVWLLDSNSGRVAGCWWDDEAKAGEAGGVWVEARGRVPDRESSREASAWLVECRCKFRKKLMPRWTPVGRGEGELGGTAVATVGRAGVVVVVNITLPC